MNFIDKLSMILGYAVIIIMVLFVFTIIVSVIEAKIKDIKDRKTVIKEGTVLYKDGKSFVIKRDLNVRFKKTKGMLCTCDEMGELSWIVGRAFSCSRRDVLGNFEVELMENCILEPYKMRKIIEERK